MRIVVAPGSYKGTLKSNDATEILTAELRMALPHASVESLVLADGGEGTIEAFSAHFRTSIATYRVRDPRGFPVYARTCTLPDGAVVVESSQAAGFALVPQSEMNPFSVTSYGVGELLAHALAAGPRTIYITMGDSATMDMGVGMLSALGVKFYSAAGPIAEPSLSNLHDIRSFDTSALDALRSRVSIIGLVDTEDYLCGEVGQVQLYGRQKGLADSDIPRVEQSFAHFASVINDHFDLDVTKVPRATGSGGIGAAVSAFFRGELLSTLEFLSEKAGLASRLKSAEVTVTGEGRLDDQTKFGKVPHFVASRSSGQCIAVVGDCTALGLRDMQQVCRHVSVVTLNPDFATTDPRRALRDSARDIAKLVRDSGPIISREEFVL